MANSPESGKQNRVISNGLSWVISALMLGWFAPVGIVLIVSKILGYDLLDKLACRIKAAAKSRQRTSAPSDWQPGGTQGREDHTYHYTYTGGRQTSAQNTDRSGDYDTSADFSTKTAARVTYTGPARQKVRRKIRSPKRFSVPMGILGGGLALAATACACVVLGNFLSGWFLMPLAIVAGSLGIPGIALLTVCHLKRQKARRYTRYASAAGHAPTVSVKKLAMITGERESDILEALQDMCDRGYFGPDAYVNVAAGRLVTDPGADTWSWTPKAAEAAPEKKAPEPEVRQDAPGPKPALSEYERMLRELHELNERIPGEAMSDRILRIESVSRAIFQAVEDKPEKRSQINSFMNYYLPTTIKLLDAYARFDAQEVTGSNIAKSKASIEGMMDTLVSAFEKQFDSLFAGEATDVSVDIQVMENMLRRDGFVGGLHVPDSGTQGITAGGH